jgi:hypothetical protein
MNRSGYRVDGREDRAGRERLVISSVSSPMRAGRATKGGAMRRSYYSKEGLARALADLERRFGIRSDDFAARYASDPAAVGVPASVAAVWAALVDDRRVGGSSDQDVAAHMLLA